MILTSPPPVGPSPASARTASGCPRNFLGNQLVYVMISPRARGLTIGVNLNPDGHCNFDCVYCETDRTQACRPAKIDLDLLSEELQRTLGLVHSDILALHPSFQHLPKELLKLQHVALSGDGEPTLCADFAGVVETTMHIRASHRNPFFKVVLFTNGSSLDLPSVQAGLKYFTSRDEVWVKLEAGTETYMKQVNRTAVPLEKVLANILLIGRQRPVIIQSLFPMINGQEPPAEEIRQFAQRLRELKECGANISLVQIYSATRPSTHSECGHLPLKSLSDIAQVVRAQTGLTVEVF